MPIIRPIHENPTAFLNDEDRIEHRAHQGVLLGIAIVCAAIGGIVAAWWLL